MQPALAQSLDAVVMAACRAEQHLRAAERRADRAVTALRATLGERGRDAGGGLIAEVEESRIEVTLVREAAATARALLGEAARR